MEKLTRTLQGTVVKISGAKTVSVRIDKSQPHPLYGKILRTSTKIMAHDPFEICEEGDIVVIAEDKPVSKNKSWKVLNKVEATK